MIKNNNPLKSPWAVLLDLTQIKRARLWDIDLSLLLPDLLHDVEKYCNSPDFRLCGVALSSSSLVYLRKVENLLKLENIPPPPPAKPDIWVPAPISLPFRRGVPILTVDHLLEALRAALAESKQKSHLADESISIPPSGDWLGIDSFLADVEAEANLLYDRLFETVGVISFAKFFGGLPWEEIVKNFLLIIFLAHQNRVRLWQKEEGGDLYIEVELSIKG